MANGPSKLTTWSSLSVRQQQPHLSESIATPTPPTASPPSKSDGKVSHASAVNSKGKGKGKGKADSESGRLWNGDEGEDEDQVGDAIDDKYSSIHATDRAVNGARGKGNENGKAKWRTEDEFVDAAEGEDLYP